MLARVFGVIEGTYTAATGIGAALAPILAALLGIEGALVVVGASLPLLALARWRTLARYEAGHRDPGAAVRAAARRPAVRAAARRRGREPHPAPGAGRGRGRRGGHHARATHGDRFFVIDEGRVEVLIDGRRVREEGPGEFFGEIALLHEVPRTATVRALDDGVLLALDRDEFVATVTGNPRALRAADRRHRRPGRRHPGLETTTRPASGGRVAHRGRGA